MSNKCKKLGTFFIKKKNQTFLVWNPAQEGRELNPHFRLRRPACYHCTTFLFCLVRMNRELSHISRNHSSSEIQITSHIMNRLCQFCQRWTCCSHIIHQQNRSSIWQRWKIFSTKYSFQIFFSFFTI